MKLSNWHTFVEINALSDCSSDTALLRKNDAQSLNLKGKQKRLSVTSALSKSYNIDSATVSCGVSAAPVSRQLV